MPRELNRVPARRDESLEMTVKVVGGPAPVPRIGEDDGGMGKLLTNPRITEVRRRE